MVLLLQTVTVACKYLDQELKINLELKFVSDHFAELKRKNVVSFFFADIPVRTFDSLVRGGGGGKGKLLSFSYLRHFYSVCTSFCCYCRIPFRTERFC